MATNSLEVVAGVAVDFEGVVGDDAEVARTPAEDRIEELRVGAGVDGLQFGIVVDEPDLPHMITQEAEAAAQLTVATRLSMSSNVDTLALAVWDEQAVHLEEAVELAKTDTDAAVDE